jgi:hypothetical protein
MKILMFGRGVISTQYAWAFEKAGHTVDFYVRPGRKAELGNSISLNIADARKNIRGNIVQQNWEVNLIEDLPLNHNYDLIFVRLLRFLPPIKQTLTGHSNMTEMKSYCQDVLQTAHEMHLPLPRYEANQAIFNKQIKAMPQL